MPRNKKYVYICSPKRKVFRAEYTGEMPEWSIGPHSKCGVRATVPGVRIPLSPPEYNERDSETLQMFNLQGFVRLD